MNLASPFLCNYLESLYLDNDILCASFLYTLSIHFLILVFDLIKQNVSRGTFYVSFYPKR